MAWLKSLNFMNRHRRLNMVVMLLCYVTSYFSRTHISCAHSFLIQNNILTAQHFGLMSAISYATLLLVKILSGATLDFFNRPKLAFCVASLACAMGTLLNTAWYTPAAFVFLFTLIKCAVTFHRISILKSLRQWYPGDHFGFIASLLQSISCLGEVGSRFVISYMLLHCHWKITWRACSAITLCGALLFAFVVQAIPNTDLSISLQAADAIELSEESGGKNFCGQQPTKRWRKFSGRRARSKTTFLILSSRWILTSRRKRAFRSER